MSNPYGDFYPLGERLPDPATYDSPQEVGNNAFLHAEMLAVQRPLSYECVELHMRGLAGLYNGGNSIDSATYDRLPASGRSASKGAAAASYAYFGKVGLGGEIEKDLEALGPHISDRDWDARLINAMQQHVGQVIHVERDRQRAEMWQSGTVHLDWHDPYLHELREQARLMGDTPYLEDGIREVLRVFGQALGPIIVGFAEVAPLDVDRRTIVHHASQSVSALPLTF